MRIAHVIFIHTKLKGVSEDETILYYRYNRGNANYGSDCLW